MTAPDFGGYATRSNVQCADGLTILPNAFSQNDGHTVPLVWQHGHDEPTNVLGHCRLVNRDDGVYAEAFFNETAAGAHAKEMVKHGDIKFLSIWANQLIKRGKDVVQGAIREVSLVLAGANPGAYIDQVNLAHAIDGADYVDGEAVITSGMELELTHAAPLAEAEETEKDLQAIMATLNEEQETAVYYLLSQALTSNDDVEHSAPADQDPPADGETAEVEPPVVTPAPVAEDPDKGTPNPDGTDNAEKDPEAGDNVQHDNLQEDNSMTHNVFDQARGGAQVAGPKVTVSDTDVQSIVHSAMKGGSFKGAVEDYVLSHGIENIDYLFPDAQTLETSPAFLSRRMEWVDKVLGSVRKTPFSRIKSISADITPDEARARGYIRGNMKNEEFFALSKRETTPQTIYKKQKLDRDDVIDITTLDVIAWLKAEMKVMLDEELASAILVADGRSMADEDKIIETKIRPIATDAELYVTTAYVNIDDSNSSIEELVDSAIENRRYYKGSGQPSFYTSETVISKFLTVKDSFGRRIYANIQEVANVLRVREIVAVETMERDASLLGIMVNLSDYSLGADRGGQATMFDDFDIDYNKLRYLIETRCSGALTVPKSALVFRKTAGANVVVTPSSPAFNATTHTLTVPTVTGVVYKNEAGTTLVTATPITLTEGQKYKVFATPTTGYYFRNNAEDEWLFTY